MVQRSLARGRLRLLWPAVATLTLALGYVDLAAGGTTVAPVLLILGYVVLVPLAIAR
jgi:hypothetical protein